METAELARVRKGAGSQVRRIDVGCVREARPGCASARTAAIGIDFGIPLFSSRATIVERTSVPVGPGRIVLLLGPSGSGKTTALEQVARRFAGACMVGRVSFPPRAAIIDRVAPGASLAEALSFLTACGLSEAPLWVRTFAELSEGERFRARLARAVAQCSRCDGASPLLCDEFCSGLHRRLARAVSYSLRKLATTRRLSVVVASSNEDVVADLQPDTIVRFHGRGRCDVEARDAPVRRTFSLRRRLKIEPGSKRDYEAFSSMHYRATDELGFVDKVFVLRDGEKGDALGIVVYAHAPLELSLRNRATDGYFSRNPSRVNRSLRILRRLVIHPDVRGCGLGHYLVRKTLPLVRVAYVECLASMGALNPVFERAGMTRVGRYDLPAGSKAALSALSELDVDPAARDFSIQVCRRRRVREIVSGVVEAWYAGTTGGGERRVARQSPQFLAQTFRGLVGSRPVYYLWQRPKTKRTGRASA